MANYKFVNFNLFCLFISINLMRLASTREKTAQAYDFALDKIGLDVMSYSIWVDYVNFLKSV